MNRDWAIPVALGVLVAGAVWAMPDGDRDDEHAGPTGGSSATSTSGGFNPAVLLPFDAGLGIDKGTVSFLVIAPRGRQAAEAELNQSGPNFAPSLEWKGPGIATFTTQVNACPEPEPGMAISCDPAWAFGPYPLPKATGVSNETRPRLGMDGYNATRATIYVFDERGLLAATNDAKANYTRFPGSPTTMDSATWYIGANSTAPNGTQKPPSFAVPLVQKLRPLMEGMPVGGVASAQSNAYVGLYGTLFITIRIDALAYAP